MKKQALIAIIISLLLHLLLFTLGIVYSDRFGKAAKPDEQVIQIDLKSAKDFKIADILPPAVEEKPDKAEHIGIYDSKVPDETVAASRPRAPARPASRGGTGAENIREKLTKFKEPDGMGYAEKKARPKPEPAAEPAMGRMPEDFYPDYKRGDHTYINVLKHQDVQYFVMMKRVLKLAWDPTQALMRDRLSGEISRGSIKVVLGIAIDRKGDVGELFVLNSSGLKEYDGEALRAVRASSPFSSPPEKFIDKDGMLRVSWTFIVYL